MTKAIHYNTANKRLHLIFINSIDLKYSYIKCIYDNKTESFIEIVLNQ